MSFTPLEVESVLAVIGVQPILDANPKFKKYQFEQGKDLPKTFHHDVLEFLDHDSKYSDAEEMPRYDYKTVLKELSAGQTEKQAQALYDAVTDHELAVLLAQQAQKIVAWGNAQLPRQPRQTVVGVKFDEPSKTDLADWYRKWQVACDPLVVMRDLLEGCLSDDQVTTLALLWPNLYQMMRDACADALIDANAAHDEDWEPDSKKTALINVLRQQSSVDPGLAAAVQQLYRGQSQKKPAPSRASSRASSDDANLTPGQQAAAGS
jgi:hypothetical protein